MRTSGSYQRSAFVEASEVGDVRTELGKYLPSARVGDGGEVSDGITTVVQLTTEREEWRVNERMKIAVDRVGGRLYGEFEVVEPVPQIDDGDDEVKVVRRLERERDDGHEDVRMGFPGM